MRRDGDDAARVRNVPRPAPDLPQPGQESVWAYPRPAVCEPTARHLRVVFAGRVIADTRRGIRVIETSHPPTYYFPRDDVASGYLASAAGASICEWKGGAVYFDVVADGRIAESAAWTYPSPTAAFRTIRNHLAFYAGRVDACFVDDELARPQEGELYGGWITSHVAGPFKGMPGTAMW